MSEDLLTRSRISPRFSKRPVTKREFKFTSSTKKTSQKKKKSQTADPKVENSVLKPNENAFDLPSPIWASSPRDTPYRKLKSKPQKTLLEISCIEPVSVKTAKNLKRIEESHFVPITTPKQNLAKNNANKKEVLLRKMRQNKTTSIGSIHVLQNSRKELIQRKNKSLSSSGNRVVKSNQKTDINNHSNKSHQKKNKSKQLFKEEKSKVGDLTVTTLKSQQPKTQSTNSQNTRKSPSVHTEPSRRKSKSLIQTKPNTELEILPVSDQNTNKKTTNKKQTSESEEGSIKRLRKSESSKNDLPNPPKSSKLQTTRKKSKEAAYLSQSYNNYSSNTNKTKSSKANSKKQKNDISSCSYLGANPKQQTGSKPGRRSRSLQKDDLSPPNIIHTKQSPNQKSVSKSSVKNSLRKSSLMEFNLKNEGEPEKTVKEKEISKFQGKKLKRKSVESTASFGKEKTNSKNNISSSSRSKLNAGKYANILSYLSTQNKEQKSNRTEKTFGSITAGIANELLEQMDQKEAEKRFSFDVSDLSSVLSSRISSFSDENEDDQKMSECDQRLNEANKYLEYIMFPGESENISLDNPKPIQLNVLQNRNSMKRTAKSLSELDVILDVMDQSIEMVLNQVSDVDKKLAISRMRNFVKEKISTDIKRQLQLIQFQNTVHQQSLQIKGLQQEYLKLKISNNRLNSKLNESTKAKVEDPTKMFNEFCKKFSEFKKSSNEMK